MGEKNGRRAGEEEGLCPDSGQKSFGETETNLEYWTAAVAAQLPTPCVTDAHEKVSGNTIAPTLGEENLGGQKERGTVEPEGVVQAAHKKNLAQRALVVS